MSGRHKRFIYATNELTHDFLSLRKTHPQNALLNVFPRYCKKTGHQPTDRNEKILLKKSKNLLS